jgi:hypothetical protein
VFEAVATRARSRMPRTAGNQLSGSGGVLHPPRSAAMTLRYRRYRDLFDGVFTGGGLARHEVPYSGTALPAYVLPAVGTIPACFA